jgi:hypothetical protein
MPNKKGEVPLKLRSYRNFVTVTSYERGCGLERVRM